MGYNIPPAGTMPTNTKDPNYEAKMLEYKEQSAKRQLAIQTLMEIQKEEAATRSNMQKAGNDALMAIISNFKS